MTILILAAGYATRLYTLTLDRPKPLLKIGKRLLLEYIFDKISELSGVKRCFIVTNQRFFDNFKEWAQGAAHFKVPVEVVNDGTASNETRLGAIRDIELVIKRYALKDDLLVIGGDNLFEFGLKAFVDFSKQHKGRASLALFDIGDIKKAKRYGVVKINSSKRVIDFREKPARPESALIATCVYYFPEEKLGLISDFLSLENKADAPGNYIRWLSEIDSVYGFVFKEDWYDIGDIKSLEEADKKYRER